MDCLQKEAVPESMRRTLPKPSGFGKFSTLFRKCVCRIRSAMSGNSRSLPLRRAVPFPVEVASVLKLKEREIRRYRRRGHKTDHGKDRPETGGSLGFARRFVE